MNVPLLDLVRCRILVVISGIQEIVNCAEQGDPSDKDRSVIQCLGVHGCCRWEPSERSTKHVYKTEQSELVRIY